MGASRTSTAGTCYHLTHIHVSLFNTLYHVTCDFPRAVMCTVMDAHGSDASIQAPETPVGVPRPGVTGRLQRFARPSRPKGQSRGCHKSATPRSDRRKRPPRQPVPLKACSDMGRKPSLQSHEEHLLFETSFPAH